MLREPRAHAAQTVARHERFCTASVVALVCGILLCLGPLTGVSAIIAGVVGLSAARARPQEVGGAGLASVGIGLGTLNVLISIIALVYVLLTMGSR